LVLARTANINAKLLISTLDFSFTHARAVSVSPLQAALMDPQQRLLLICAAEALARSGGVGASASDRAAFGVHVGVSSMDYGNKVWLDVAMYFWPCLPLVFPWSYLI
jgi:hypothetical protein